MTVAHLTPALAARDLDEAVGAMRDRGLRVTAARRLVLEGLFTAAGPVSAEAIAGGLDGQLPGCDLASVYRNLDALERVGLARHVHLGHGPGLYARRGADEVDYLACERCHSIQVLDRSALDEVRDRIRDRFGFEALLGHFPLIGLCSGCVSG